MQEKIDLAQFDEDFAEAEIKEREFEPVPDGKYQVNVKRVELTRSKTSDTPMLKWTLEIIAPSCQGRILFRNNMIGSPENIKWLKTDLHTCGLDLAKLSDLPANLASLLDVKLEVTKRTRGENENVYFNRRIVTTDGAQSPGGANWRSEDIPF
jgi:hypothetical protein